MRAELGGCRPRSSYGRSVAGGGGPARTRAREADIDLPHARRLETTLATGEQRDQRESPRFYLDRGSAYQQENDHDAVGELNRALFLSPYDAEAHLLLGRIHLRNGRVREAIDALKISLWSAETPQAHVVLGEARFREGRRRSASRGRTGTGARAGIGRGASPPGANRPVTSYYRTEGKRPGKPGLFCVRGAAATSHAIGSSPEAPGLAAAHADVASIQKICL